MNGYRNYRIATKLLLGFSRIGLLGVRNITIMLQLSGSDADDTGFEAY